MVAARSLVRARNTARLISATWGLRLEGFTFGFRASVGHEFRVSAFDCLVLRPVG